MSEKPLGRKGYGHIPHLPESRMGPGDHKIHEGQAKIATEKVRDRFDEVIITEKLDGSNVCIAKKSGIIIPLTRSGYHCKDSRHKQHHLFAEYVSRYESLFMRLLNNDERLVGEWLTMAHGTRYVLSGPPFFAFDWMIETQRKPFDELDFRCKSYGIKQPKLIHRGGALSVEAAMKRLGKKGFHGALEQIEGAVWRVETKGQFNFICKYVRPDKVDGKYIFDGEGSILPEMTWNEYEKGT